MYGGYPVYLLGLVWLMIWSIISGFSRNEIMINFCRALAGLGPAAFLPSSVMLLGSIYRPGWRKNVVFSTYGAAAPFGFFVGIFFAGLTARYTTWSWFFWVGAILVAITSLVTYLTVPSDMTEKRNSPVRIKMDWLGGVLIVSGLILFTFAIIDSSIAPGRWRNPYIIVTFIAGILLLLTAAYVEVKIATQPLLPASLFKVPCMPALMIALLFTYGSLGIFFLYATYYMENIMGASPFQVTAWYAPCAGGGIIIATVGGFFLHRIPGTLLIIFSGVSWIISPLLFAIAPQGANYWAYVFPSMICATIGIDITYNVANIFITTSLPKSQQGLAGAVIMILLNLGIAVLLGFADIVYTGVQDRLPLREAYHAVFWFEVACASAALLILICFVKIKKAESEFTVDEKAELGMSEGSGVGGGEEGMDRDHAEEEGGGMDEKRTQRVP